MDYSKPPSLTNEVFFKEDGPNKIYIVRVFASLLTDGTVIEVEAFAEDPRTGDPLVSVVTMDEQYLGKLILRVFYSYSLMGVYSEIVHTELPEIDTSDTGLIAFGDALHIVMLQEYLAARYHELVPIVENQQIIEGI